MQDRIFPRSSCGNGSEPVSFAQVGGSYRTLHEQPLLEQPVLERPNQKQSPLETVPSALPSCFSFSLAAYQAIGAEKACHMHVN